LTLSRLDNVREMLAPASRVDRRRPRDPAVRELVTTVWTHVVPDGVGALRVVPDAAIDLVFADGRLRVAGPDTSAALEAMRPNARVLGFQLRPGAAESVLGVPASAVRDDRVDMSDLWGRAGASVLEAMVEAGTVDRAAVVLETALARRQRSAPAPDGLAGAIAERVRAFPGTRSTGALADELGLSERQLRRRCTAAFGYGPKVLTRIVRLQSVLSRLRDTPDTRLALLAAESGYADQAHLNHEVGALTGLTPASVRLELASVSDFDKTAAV
jgi:AraC-like DNA-binding protein